MTDKQALEKIYFETEDDITVFAVLTNSAEEIEYSEKWLDKQLTAFGCSGLNVLNSAHEKIAELLSSNKPGRVMLGYKLDAKVEIKVSDDFLSARLYITAPEGGGFTGF